MSSNTPPGRPHKRPCDTELHEQGAAAKHAKTEETFEEALKRELTAEFNNGNQPQPMLQCWERFTLCVEATGFASPGSRVLKVLRVVKAVLSNLEIECKEDESVVYRSTLASMIPAIGDDEDLCARIVEEDKDKFGRKIPEILKEWERMFPRYDGPPPVEISVGWEKPASDEQVDWEAFLKRIATTQCPGNNPPMWQCWQQFMECVQKANFAPPGSKRDKFLKAVENVIEDQERVCEGDKTTFASMISAIAKNKVLCDEIEWQNDDVYDIRITLSRWQNMMRDDEEESDSEEEDCTATSAWDVDTMN